MPHPDGFDFDPVALKQKYDALVAARQGGQG